MKKTILVLGCLLTVGLTSVSCNRDDDNGTSTIISTTQLPTSSQTFLKTHFSGVGVTKVEKDNTPDSDGTVYEVDLANGFEVNFDVNGNWTDVTSESGATLPSSVVSLLPVNITKFLAANYPNARVTEMEVKSYGYQVEIDNNTELRFDKNGGYLGTGDSGSNENINTSSLPTSAQTFLKTHFSGVGVTKVEKDNTPDSDGTVYEVDLANGFEVNFDVNGNWTDVTSESGATLPSSVVSLLPVNITKFLASNYPNAKVTEMEVKSYGYQVEIDNNTELRFDKNGGYLGTGN